MGQVGVVNYAGYGRRNYNLVRHQPKVVLGPVRYGIAMMGLALVAGLVYVTQGPRATAYDYEIQSVQTEVARYESMRDDLALENARLTSVVASERSEVAANMVDAGTGTAIGQ
jgi:hypothetical protein